MRIAMISAKNYERVLLDELNTGHGHDLVYFDTLLGVGTASLAAGFPAVSVFVNDLVDGDVLRHLATGGTKLVATPASIILTWKRQRNLASGEPGQRQL